VDKCSVFVRFLMYDGVMQPPKDFSTLFLDMNSFFASVEQQVRPELRGQPIGVSPYTGPSGCIIAASYEAKAMGVRICRNEQAKRLCPQIEIVEARPALYISYHQKIKKVIESVTPYFEVCSVDEFALKLDRCEQNEVVARQIAAKLKKKIRDEVGDSLRCSVGVGPSKFLAKMAAERQKPDGFTIVRLNELEDFYSKLKLTDLTGINVRMEAQLNRLGVISPLQLFHLSAGEMTQRLKHCGRAWYFRLRGYEVDSTGSPWMDSTSSPQVDSTSSPRMDLTTTKTIGHSHVLAPEFRTREGAMAILRKLIFKASYRLRAGNFLAGGLMASISFLDHSNFHISKKFVPFCDDATAWEKLKYLLLDCKFESRPIHLAISFFNLSSSKASQLSIFDDLGKIAGISKAQDKINDIYGADTVCSASMFTSRQSAPDRIPFGKPRYEIRQ